MKLLIITDAWQPQVNGVVTCLKALQQELGALGHQVSILSPADFRSLPCPTYPEIPLVWNLWQVGKAMKALNPDAVHLATEGPLGWAARHWLTQHGLAFSSAIHTRFPEYVSSRWPWWPIRWSYALLRHFHQPSQAILVTTERMQQVFSDQGFERLKLWRKGVDTRIFRPAPAMAASGKTVFLYVGRLAPEKNLSAFLELDLPGEKWVIGDGPQRQALEQAYPQVHFLGYQQGEALALTYQAASVLVFPSLTDTYGLVMLEAMACGTPVAAFPVPGPLDVVQQGINGVLDDNLQQACLAALQLDRRQCAEIAALYSWQASAQEFLSLQPLLIDRQLLAAKQTA
ncbi:glycosyltransferase family 4 protein [Marinospirillum alkaliphilum]|uniref:Glycosyltransferase involved in cell wall bisynthesis n=1 Tax=Marinospirillum alkaliphilum DSM 21637 TaxID=1122209 RepID=A0A1K1TG33_9GAMM|nr:glycosyltransferase family 1 protein [Marinospirillum alkaliphilum]SFW99442.1 Glycosyltransferase involved in cell wall bisynthesis [Marinospirillum alkaliphilum DSM 21637]